MEAFPESENLVNHFFDDLTGLFARFLTPSNLAQDGSSSSNDSLGHDESRLDSMEVLASLLDQAKPRAKGGLGGVDFSTESAVFLLRLRSLLERYVNKRVGGASAGQTRSTSSMESKFDGKGLLLNGLRIINGRPSAMVQRESFPLSSTGTKTATLIAVTSAKSMITKPTMAVENRRAPLPRRRKQGVDATCQVRSTRVDVAIETMGGSASIHSPSRHEAVSIEVAHARLTLSLQRHTSRSISSLERDMEESAKTSGVDGFVQRSDALRIQTRFIDGLSREMRREQSKLEEAKQEESEELKVYRLEMSEILERLGNVVATMPDTVVVEEGDMELQEVEVQRCGTNDRRASSSCTQSKKSDLTNTLTPGATGFIRLLVLQNVQCFLSVLALIGSSVQRWSYLEKVIFLIDSDSPVPTVPGEVSRVASSSHASTNLNINEKSQPGSSYRSASGSPVAWSGKNTDSTQQCELPDHAASKKESLEEGEVVSLERFMKRLCPCEAYEMVRKEMLLRDEKGVW